MDKPINFDEVADIYDHYVITDIDIDFFLEAFKDQASTVLELMCGTGRVSIPLISNGVKLTCVDYSKGMLMKFQAKLRQLGLNNTALIEADVRTLDLGQQFDFVFIPFNSFMELADESSQIMALENIYTHLNDNGIFICTLHNPALRVRQAVGEKIWRGEFNLPLNKKLQLYSIEHYDHEAHTIYGTQFFYFLDEQGAIELERHLDIRFSLIAQPEFETMVKNKGFNILRLYGDYNRGEFNPETSPFMIYFLKK